jgi:hypothetical protein
LPYDNHLIIYCVDDNEKNFQKNLDYLYHGIHNIENVTIEFLPEYRVSSAHNSNAFLDKKIKNIIVCDDDQLKNIEVATDLVERVYRHQKGSPKILTAIYDKGKIAHRIHEMSDEDVLLKDVYTFACADKVCSIDNILGEKRYTIAKFMHAGYGNIFDQNALIPSNSIADTEWEKSIISQKSSNLSQAQHIKVKLKALGLKIIESQTTDKEALLCYNRNILDTVLSKYVKTNELFNEILAFTSGASKNLVDNYFPNSNNMESLFVRLINSEHERWNRFHFLNNWVLHAEKIPSLKLHDCLKPFSEFSDKQKQTLVYDIFSVVYIANYCAQVGYILEPIKPTEITSSPKIVVDVLTIGVTGHRDIVENDALVSAIDEQLMSLKKENRSFEILSPLADGADMLVAERAIAVLGAKLKVLFPFDPAVYQCGSKKYGYGGIVQKERFSRLLKQSIENNTIKWINSNPNDRNIRDQFEKCGQTIVDQCDVLFALYDGKASGGKGGTAEIVEYAKERGSQVFLIDVRRKEGQK